MSRVIDYLDFAQNYEPPKPPLCEPNYKTEKPHLSKAQYDHAAQIAFGGHWAIDWPDCKCPKRSIHSAGLP